MKFFKLFAKKQQPKKAASEMPQMSGTTIVTDAATRAKVIQDNFAFALSYAANMQGITLRAEQLSTILETVNRVVNGTEETSTVATPAPNLPAAANNNRSFKTHFQRFDAWVRLHYALRINTLTGCTEIAERRETACEQVYRTVSNYDTCSLTQDAMCDDINIWKVDVENYLASNRVALYHPFLQYFDLLPKWDGKDRVTQLAERVSTNSAWVRGFHRWMLGVTAQWMGYARKQHGICNVRANSVAPILISEHQGWGKSTFCRMLLPEALQNYYTDSFDVAQPTACEVKLTEYGLINLDEFDRIPASRNAQLKNIMQMTALHVRKAYQKNVNNRFRIASFIGTSNRRDLLSDTTGSRRFLCVELEHAIDCETPVEYTQLYAQLKEEILSGERYWFSDKEEKEIQANNRLFYKSTPVEELFHKQFRMADEHTEGAEHLPSIDIYTVLKTTYPSQMAGISSHKFARMLPSFANRKHTYEGNGYYLLRR